MAERIGVLGGTFDPIHNEHLLMARAAVGALPLDRVIFVPVGEPSHRDATVLSSAKDRCARSHLPSPPTTASRSAPSM